MMEIERILEALRQMLALQTELLELARHKRQVLIASKVDDLSAVVHKESRLIRQVSESERQWLKAAADFLHSRGIKPDADITVADIANMLSGQAEKESLQSLQGKLLHTMEQLKQINAGNQRLIEQSLQFIDYSIELLTGGPEDGAFYRHPAHQTKSRNGLFDTKA